MKHGLILRSLGISAVVFILAPIFALLTKVSWSHFFSDLSDLTSIKLSLWTSLLSTLVSLLLGIPLAWILAKSSGRLANVIRPLVLSPIVLPPTVAGIALISLMGRNGVIGRSIYNATGWAAPFTSSAVVLSGIFVGLPFVVLMCESNFRQLPKEIEDAAIIDRVSERQLFAKVALPQSRNAIAASAALAWARAIGEFGATLMFAGSLPGKTQTWPMQIYQDLDINSRSAYAYSVGMLFIAFAIVFLLRKPLSEALR